MRYRPPASLASLALLFAAALLPAAVKGETFRCGNADAVVVSSGSAEAETACGAAAAAAGFLEANGLWMKGPIEIHIVAKFPAGKDYTGFGNYDRAARKAHVLSFPASREAPVFGLLMDRDLHRSLVVHEVAHAFAADNFTVKNPPWAASEYIAYVTQIATMPPALRQRALAVYQGTGFESPLQINPIFLMMAPDIFAAKAYRHFERPESGAVFFRRLLTEDFLSDRMF